MGSFRGICGILALSHALLANAVDPNDLVFKSSFERCDNVGTPTPGAVLWDGGGDGESWSDPENWENDTLPTNGDDVWIGDSGGITVVFNSAPDTLSINILDACESLNITGGTLELTRSAWTRTSLEVSGGNLVVTGDLAVLNQLQQSIGTLKGTGTVTVAGKFNWTGGTQSESGVTTVEGGTQISGGVHHLNGRTLTLNAASTYSGGAVRLMNAATLNINSSFDILTDDDIYQYSGTLSTINNTVPGVITKSAGTDVTKLQGHFNNNGAIKVNSGEIWVGHGSGTGNSSGSFEVAADATLGVSGNNTMTGASSFTGEGGFIFHGGGTTAIQGGYSLLGTLGVGAGTLSFPNAVTIEEDVTVTGGTLEYLAASAINADVYMSNGTLTAASTLPISGFLQQSNGTLEGVGTVTVTGLFTWTGGNQYGSGVTVANAGAAVSGGVHQLSARTLTLNAASTYSGGAVRLMNAATLNNNGTFDIQTDENIYHYSGAVSTLNNNVAGTITKSAGNSDTLIGADTYNSGSIAVTSGSLSFGKTFEQLPAGILEVGIASGNFDNYTVTEAAILNGTLNVSLDGGFDPGFGATFEIMTVTSGAGSVAGAFANETGMTIGVGKKFVTDYTDPKKVVLEVVPDP